MSKLLLLFSIMMATWMVVSCGTTDGSIAGPELGYYEEKKDMKDGSYIFSASSVWHCVIAGKPWLNKDCE